MLVVMFLKQIFIVSVILTGNVIYIIEMWFYWRTGFQNVKTMKNYHEVSKTMKFY